MSCPFRHLWKAGEAGSEGREPEHPAPDTSAPPQQATAEGPPPPAASANAPAGRCPFPHAAAAAPAAGEGQQQPAAAAPPTAGVCPLGFSSGKGPALGEYQCLICRALLYDCVRAACGHRYCAACAARCQDCPTCGADVSPVTPDPATQALVELYIQAHAATHEPFVLEQEGAAGGGVAPPPGRAMFLLQQGLRALAGGNLTSATARLQACKQEVLQQLQQHTQHAQQEAAGGRGGSGGADAGARPAAATANPAAAAVDAPAAAPASSTAAAVGSKAVEGAAAAADAEEHVATAGAEAEAGGPCADADAGLLRCQLGAVCGCLGDACLRWGDAAGAVAHYEESAAHLAAAGGSAEVQRELAISLSKTGEAWHTLGLLPQAVHMYRRSLALRRSLLALAAPGAAAAAAGSSTDAPAAGGAAAAGMATAAAAPMSAGLEGGAAAAAVAAGPRPPFVAPGSAEAEAGGQLAGQAVLHESHCSALLDTAMGCIKLADALRQQAELTAELAAGEPAQPAVGGSSTNREDRPTGSSAHSWLPTVPPGAAGSGVGGGQPLAAEAAAAIAAPAATGWVGSEALLAEAQQLLQAVGPSLPAQPPALQRKAASLAAFLRQMA